MSSQIVREYSADPRIVCSLGCRNGKSLVAILLKHAANSRGNMIQPLVYDIVGVMPVFNRYGLFGSMGKLINDGTEQGNSN